MATTPDQIAAIRARADAATPGPWDAYSVPATRREAGHCAVDAGETEVRVARFEGGWFDAAFIAAARTDVPALLDLLAERDAEIERLHTWDGLMSLLDEHWPEDVFPTRPYSEAREVGPSVVSLLRWIERLRAERDSLTVRLDAVRALVEGWKANAVDALLRNAVRAALRRAPETTTTEGEEK